MDYLALVDPKTGRLKGYTKILDSLDSIKALANPLRYKILELLSEAPRYSNELADLLNLSEQLVYYHVSHLRKTGLIREIESIKIRGTMAIRYALSADGFSIVFGGKDTVKKYPLLSPIFKYLFEKDKKVYLVLSSPEPHGPFRSRGRDHYLAAQLAYVIGAVFGASTYFKVILDTDIREDLTNANLIVFGGPAVNMVTSSVNDKLPIYFDVKRDNMIVSRLSGKTYSEDGCGIVELVDNPMGSGKLILIAGKHLSGTKAALLTLLNMPMEIAQPNSYDEKTIAHVVEGVDSDGDGEVDDAIILE